MHEVFINYRTGDGHDAAALIDRVLSEQFGAEHVFFASRSIEPGAKFPPAMLEAARQCRVLLAVIGESWLSTRNAHGRNPLDDEHDWTRREIEAALNEGTPIIPVLVGRRTERLSGAGLPSALAELADFAYRRYDHRERDSGVEQIVADVSAQVPELGPAKAPAPSATSNSISGSARQAIQAHNLTISQGSGPAIAPFGPTMSGDRSILHAGHGDINAGTTIHGDHTNHVVGTNNGGMHQSSDRRRNSEDGAP